MAASYVLAVHGGAGTITPGIDPSAEAPYHDALKEAVSAGESILAQGGNALDAVVASVVFLEDCPLFNAGRGSVFTSDATIEMDASVMDGRGMAAGAAAGLRSVRNPVLLARAVMEQSDCVLLAGEGAVRFAREYGLALAEPDYFATQTRMNQLLRMRAATSGVQLDHDAAGSIADANEPIDSNDKFGTVGAVARDRHGNLASAVSTGGMTNKRPGRVGDTPVIGAGCYADNRTVAVACTGTGEHFMRAVAAYDVAARLDYGQASLQDAARRVIFERLHVIGGRGGMIAIDHNGELAMPFNTSGMYRAWVVENSLVESAIFAD